jgi:hypothetical protein
MKTVVLDYPTSSAQCASWELLEQVTSLTRYTDTSFPQLLERARTADVLVTWRMPLRREVLDYITRPRILIVPETDRETLVELPIAVQLGISVYGFVSDPNDPCQWITNVANLLAVSE